MKQEQTKLRQYEGAWKTIAANTRMSTTFKVPKVFHRTFIQAIKKEKTIANMRRKALDMPAYGKLTIVRTETTVTFTLEHNGDLL